MIFVTGGTGFVGAHLLYHLVSQGESVYALKRKSSDINNTRYIFNFYGKDTDALMEKINWVEGDILDYGSLEYVINDNITKVYHTAALVSFNSALNEEMMRINEEGTANLVNICLERKIEKFCFVSSIGALGNSKNGETIDEFSYWQGGKNHSTYSLSKFRAEMEVWRATKEGLNAVIVNPSVILGPGNWKGGSPRTFYTISKGLKFYTTGGTGFIDVRDVAKAMILLMESKIENERFLLNGANLSYKELFSQIAHALNKKAPTINANKWMVYMAWKLEKIKYLLFGIEPLITKESARTSLKTTKYTSDYFIKQTNFSFTPIEDTIKETAEYFKHWKE